jgi:outer membrane protein
MNRSLRHAALVLWTAASLIVSPVSAQASASGMPHGEQAQVSPSTASQDKPEQNQTQTQNPAPSPVQDQQLPPPPPTAKKLDRGPNYSKGKSWFPDLFSPYVPMKVEEPSLTNTPKIDQLIQNGKLMLSLDDAVSLALENNLDIRVQRFNVWIIDTGVLKARAGGIPQTASAQQVVLGLPPAVAFDPQLTAQVNWERSAQPVNNIFTSGFAAAAPTFIFYSANYNFGYTQGFHTGTSISVQWQNNRFSTNSPGYIFNPAVQSILSVGFSQPLLNGCCRLPNTRFIIEAKNSTKIADAQFRQAVTADISTTSNDYWELVYDREFVKVEEQAVAVSQKLYNDNKKELEIGTVAPLDVLTAESQLATDKQNLVAAQTTRLVQETKLLFDITKNPLAPSVAGVEIVPTTSIQTPEVVENVPLNDLMAEAWQKRPEMTIDRLTLENDKIEVKVTRNALLPSLSLVGQYEGIGLAGVNTTATQTGAAESASPTALVNSSLLAQSLLAPQVTPALPIAYAASPSDPVVTGLGTALRGMINASNPTYFGGINMSMPFRNRSAQADSAHALLSERQQEVSYRQLQNTIFVAVRQSQVQLGQDRSQVTAAQEATKLAQQTLDGEQKKYQLGTSNSYNVVLKARDLTNAQSVELRARINLVEALVAFNQAMGRTLEANNITLADALRGKVSHTPNIPGALDADDVPAPDSPGEAGKK